MTAGNQFVDGITGQQHHVQRLTGLYALCRIHPANRFNRHWLTACGLPSNGQIGQHLARGHGGNTAKRRGHSVASEGVEMAGIVVTSPPLRQQGTGTSSYA